MAIFRIKLSTLRGPKETVREKGRERYPWILAGALSHFISQHKFRSGLSISLPHLQNYHIDGNVKWQWVSFYREFNQRIQLNFEFHRKIIWFIYIFEFRNMYLIFGYKIVQGNSFSFLLVFIIQIGLGLTNLIISIDVQFQRIKMKMLVNNWERIR